MAKLDFGDKVFVVADRYVDSKPADFTGMAGVVVEVDERIAVGVAFMSGERSRFHPSDLRVFRDERRERIATAVAQGLLANGGKDYGGGTWSNASLAAQAVDFADALIEALDKPEGA